MFDAARAALMVTQPAPASEALGHSSVKVTARYGALVKVLIFEQAISRLSRGPVLVSSSSSFDNSHVTK